MVFKRGEAGSSKPDNRGKVVVKIILQDPRLVVGQPVSGNRKEEVVVDETTVGEVADAINLALFGESPSSAPFGESGDSGK